MTTIPEMLGGVPEEVVLDDLIPMDKAETTDYFEFSEDAVKDLESISVGATGETKPVTPETLYELESKQYDDIEAERLKVLEEQVAKADNPMQVAQLLEQEASVEEKDLEMPDVRTNAIAKSKKLDSTSAEQLRRIVNYNNSIVEELQKKADKVWEGTPLLGFLGDLLSLTVPVAGFLDEEIDKYSLDFAKKIKELSQAGNTQEVEKISNSIEELLKANKMTLTRNNNSLLTLAAYDRLISEVKLGLPSLLAEEGSAVERGQYVGTALWGGVEVTGLGSLGRLAKGLSTIFKRVLPRNIDEIKTKNSITSPVIIEGRPLVNVVEKKEIEKIVKTVKEKASPEQISTARNKVNQAKKELKALRVKEKAASKLRPAQKKKALKSLKVEIGKAEDKIKGLEDNLTSLIATRKPTKISDVDLREDIRQVDANNFLDPIPFRKKALVEGIQQATMDVGLKNENAIMRSLPTLGDNVSTNGLPDAKLTQLEMNEMNLVDATLFQMGSKRAQVLQKELGEAFTVQTSNIRYVEKGENNKAFAMDLTDASGSYFKSLDEAIAVQKRLFGYDSEVLSVGDRYTVRVTKDHIFNPKFDTKTPEGMHKAIMGSSGRYFIDPLRKLGEDWTKTGMILSDTNSSLIKKLTQDFNKAIKSKWSYEFQNDLGRVLDKYQELGADGFDLKYSDLEAMFPKDKVEKLWESFSDVKNIMNEIYKVSDRNFRMDLEKNNFRLLDTGEADNFNFVRQITAKDELDPKELVLDVATGNKKAVGDFESLDDVVIVMNRFSDEAGEYRLVKVNRENVKPLPKSNLLNMRKGYIPRTYTDTGWVVRTPTVRTIGGIKKEQLPVTHIVENKEQAERIANKIVEDALKDFEKNSGLEGLELQQGIAKLRKDLESKKLFSRSRENQELSLIYANDDEASFGFGSVHTRNRGEQLEGSEGKLAPILPPLEAISKRINNLSIEMGKPITSSLQTKFSRMYSEFLEKGEFTSWNDNLGSMIGRRKAATIPQDVMKGMEDLHDYINTMRGVRNAGVFQEVDALISNIFPKGVGIGKYRTNDPISNSFELLATVANDIWITGRPLFQIPTNLMQILGVVRRYPVSFTKTATKSVLNGVIAVAGKMGGKDVTPLMAKNLGVSEQEYKQISDYFFNKSGMFDSAVFTDDVMNYMLEASAITSKNKALHYLKESAIALPKAARNTSVALQDMTIRVTNMTAFWTELSHDIWKTRKAGKTWSWNNKTAERIQFRARKITNTQNNANRFKHQDSAELSTVFKFVQHIQKVFLDEVVDPALGIVGKKTGKEFSINAENKIVAAQVTLFNAGMFGGAGLLGAEMLRDLYMNLGEKYPEILSSDEPRWKLARFWLQGGMLNEIVSGGTSRVNPAALLDTIPQYLNKDVTTAIGGAPVAAGLGVFDSVMNVAALLKSGEALDTKEKFYTALSEISRSVAGLKDAERAYVAYKTMTHPYVSSLSGNISVSTKEAIAQAFSVTPEDVLIYWDKQAESKPFKKVKDLINLNMDDRVIEVFLRKMNLEIATLADTGEIMDGLKLLEMRQYWITKAKQALGNSGLEDKYIEDKFKQFTMNPNMPHYESYVRPFINTGNLTETEENLRFLLEREKGKAEVLSDKRFISFLQAILDKLELRRGE